MIMKKFSSKPALLEGEQWFVTKTPSDDAKPFVDWIKANGGKATFLYDFLQDKGRHEPRIIIENDESSIDAKPGDWIVRDHYGKFWAYDPAVFANFAFPISDESHNLVIGQVLDPQPQIGSE